MTTTHTPTMHDHALTYAKRGYHIFPVWWINDFGTCGCGNRNCKDPGKHPVPYRGVWDATTDLTQIAEWWAKHPRANIGWHPGPSGHLAIDLDKYKDEFDATATGEIITKADEETLTSLTGGGGNHLVYALPSGEKFGSNRGSLPPGIDIRCWGGYIILSPSNHKSGNRYQWETGYGPEEMTPAPLPQKLYDILKAAQQTAQAAKVAIKANLPEPDVNQWRLPGWLIEDLDIGHLDNDRSVNDWRVMCALAERGLSDDDITAVWQHYPIGTDGKYADDGDRYLSMTLGKVRAKVGTPVGRYNGYQNGVYVGIQGNPNGVVGNTISFGTNGNHTTTGATPAAGSAQQSSAQTTTPPPASGGQQAAANSASVKLNKPTQIYELALKHCSIFASDDGSVYAMVNMGGHFENMNVRSMRFRQWLGKLYYDKTGMVAGKSSCEEAMEILSFETGTTRETFLRVGGNGVSIYIDLGNSQWEAVEIDASGWRILSNAPVSFRRTKKMKPLPTPVKVATADAALLELWQLVNIVPEDRILVLAWLLAAMRHKGPYPVLTLIAEAGSAKTTTAQALKRLISPYVAKTRSRPKTVEDIYVAANNDWILVYDNLSTIPQDISDAFCRLATGGGYATRELYENLEEVVIDRQQPLIINGVADIVRKGDLASRVLTVSLPEITADRRMDESEWEQRFVDAHPRILGALLDLLSAVLAELPKVKTPLPRMADFAKMGVALDTAIGITGQSYSFAERYAESTRLGTMTIIENSPVYRPLWRFMKDHGGQWDGTASSLLEELRKKASSVELFNLPKASNALVRELSGIAPNLRSARIIDVRKERTKKGSHVSLAPLPDFDKGELDSPYVPDPLDSVPTP